MIPNYQILIFQAVFILPLITASSATNCNGSCGPNHTSKPLSYPFGFSAGCPILLNCSETGETLIGEFPVRLIQSNNITVAIEARCNRSIQSLHSLFTNNYAPTSRNAILLKNCALAGLPCKLPEIMVQTHFESPDCGSNTTNISCYAEDVSTRFLKYETVMESQCQNLLSSISSETFRNSAWPLSLEVQVLQLEWWLEGDCGGCSNNAICSTLVSPVNGKPGFRCKCTEGLVGDGFRAGSGCRKASSQCNLAKYMSGKCGGMTRMGVLAGGVAAGACLMIGLGLICCFIRRRSKQKARSITKRHLSKATGLCTIPIYPYKEIEKATNNFSDKQRLGTGAYATVYGGKLHSHEWVAIKRIKHRDTDNFEQVMNEIKLLSSVTHPNLVRLLGCSIEHGEQILVFEFMPNGTLFQHLHRERGDGLPWPARLAIAIETAQAIAHLHSAISPPIYHRDIKSSNILLDHKFVSKVADFGLSRLGRSSENEILSHISTAPQGTPGYLDPQYHLNFHLSDKSDVYSFGVVLVEIITAKKVVDFSRHQNEINLAALATDRIAKGLLEEIIDPLILVEAQTDGWILPSVNKVAELAFRCLAFQRDVRPSMMEVAAELEQIRVSRTPCLEEISCVASSEMFSCSFSSNLSEKPLKTDVLNKGGVDVEKEKESKEKVKDFSPVSVQETWLSDVSSPSSNSLLNNATQ